MTYPSRKGVGVGGARLFFASSMGIQRVKE